MLSESELVLIREIKIESFHVSEILFRWRFEIISIEYINMNIAEPNAGVSNLDGGVAKEVYK